MQPIPFTWRLGDESYRADQSMTIGSYNGVFCMRPQGVYHEKTAQVFNVVRHTGNMGGLFAPQPDRLSPGG
jgi:hypothetical protein